MKTYEFFKKSIEQLKKPKKHFENNYNNVFK